MKSYPAYIPCQIDVFKCLAPLSWEDGGRPGVGRGGSRWRWPAMRQWGEQRRSTRVSREHRTAANGLFGCFPSLQNSTGCSAEVQETSVILREPVCKEFKKRIWNCLRFSKPLCCLLFINSSRRASSMAFSHREEPTFVQSSEGQN